MSSSSEAIEIYVDESATAPVGPHVCDLPSLDRRIQSVTSGSLLPKPLSALVGGGENVYRDPALHALAAESLVSAEMKKAGLRLPTTVLSALPARPPAAQRRGIGSDPHASTAKKPSRARVQKRGRLGDSAGGGGGGGSGSGSGGGGGGGGKAVNRDEAAGTTSVRTYSARELTALDLPSLVEHRERLRDLVSSVNDALVDVLLESDRIAIERNRLVQERGGTGVGVGASAYTTVAAAAPFSATPASYSSASGDGSNTAASAAAVSSPAAAARRGMENASNNSSSGGGKTPIKFMAAYTTQLAAAQELKMANSAAAPPPPSTPTPSSIAESSNSATAAAAVATAATPSHNNLPPTPLPATSAGTMTPNSAAKSSMVASAGGFLKALFTRKG